MSETSKTAKIILVLYLGLGYNRSHIRSMVQYSTKMIFAVLDVSLIMDLNIGETDKVFCINNNVVICFLLLVSQHHRFAKVHCLLLSVALLGQF